MKRKIWIALLTALAFGISGCSMKDLKSRNKLDESKLSKFGRKKEIEDLKEGYNDSPDSITDAGGESTFSIGGEGGILSGLRGGGGGSVQGIRANKLFAGALDVVMGLPIRVASREGGFVSTEWKTDPNDPRKRYRLNIRVTGRDPYGEVKVVVLRQERIDGQWMDRPADKAAARHIGKKIRKMAQVARP